MFASKVKSQVELEGGTVIIKKLSARRLEEARERKQLQFFGTAKAMGGEVLRAIRSLPETEVKAAAEQHAQKPDSGDERYGSFDRDAVLKAGIDSWSFNEKCNAESIDDLDEPAANAIFRAIVDLSLPAADPKAEEERQAKD